jgi:hypothetical protein
MNQLEFNFLKPRDATPEEFDEWQKKELQWWGDKQLKFVAFASIFQILSVGMMLLAFYTIGKFI